MSETPKCTSWLGHKFEGRYSSEPNDRLKSFKVSNILPEDLPTLLTVRVYERDICVRCGVKGASEIASNAANILAVWRNRRLEEEISTADNEALKRQLSEKPGVILNVAKQRHGDFEGKIGLWFDQPTYRYQSSHDRSLWNNRVYPIERAYEAAA